MGISLSGGPWQYNRFDLAEASKPDYLDFDKDGDKKEPMKKALKEKGKKPVSEKKELPDFIKKKVEEKKGKKKDDCECDKKEVKEWVSELIDEGHDLSEYTWDDMIEMFNEGLRHRDAKTGEVTDKPEIGKIYYTDGPRQKSSVKKQKVDPFGGRFKKEEVCEYLMTEGFVNNPVSAEIMFNHMSEEWLDAIEEMYKGKHGQSEKEYQDGRSYGGKLASGDSKSGPKGYVSRMFKDKPVKPGEKPSPLKMSKGDRNDLDIRKNNVMKKAGYSTKN